MLQVLKVSMRQEEKQKQEMQDKSKMSQWFPVLRKRWLNVLVLSQVYQTLTKIATLLLCKGYLRDLTLYNTSIPGQLLSLFILNQATLSYSQNPSCQNNNEKVSGYFARNLKVGFTLFDLKHKAT